METQTSRARARARKRDLSTIYNMIDEAQPAKAIKNKLRRLFKCFEKENLVQKGAISGLKMIIADNVITYSGLESQLLIAG